MANPNSVPSWLTLVCPFCGGQFQVRTADSLGVLFCPRCGSRVDSVRAGADPQAPTGITPETIKPAPIQTLWPNMELTGPTVDDDPHARIPMEQDWQILPPSQADSERLLEQIPLEEEDPEPPPASSAAEEPIGLRPLDDWEEIVPGEPLSQEDSLPLSSTPEEHELPALVPLPEKREPLEIGLPVPEGPYDVSRPDLWMAPVPHPLADPASVPEEPEVQRPLTWPLCQGVYTFPWHFDTLRVWVIAGLSLTLVALLGAGNYYLILHTVIDDQVEHLLMFYATILYTTVFCFYVLLISSYVAAYLLDAVQETAHGHERMRWPENTLWERASKLFHMLLVGLGSVLPVAMLVLPLRHVWPGGIVGAVLFFVPLLLLFPLFLLSSLANQSPLLLVNGKVLLFLLRKPRIVALLCLLSTALSVLGGVLGYLTIVRVIPVLALVTGFVWASCLFIYGRLLGRVAWLIAREDMPVESPVRKRKKRKKIKT